MSKLQITVGGWRHLLGDLRNTAAGPNSGPGIPIQSFPFILSEVKRSLLNVY